MDFSGSGWDHQDCRGTFQWDGVIDFAFACNNSIYNLKSHNREKKPILAQFYHTEISTVQCNTGYDHMER